MALPPRDKSFQGLLKDHDFRIALVERRLGANGTGGGGSGWVAVNASEATKGIAEIATSAEAEAGTDHTRIITPRTLAERLAGLGGGGGGWTAVNASETVKGIAEIATLVEAEAATDHTRIITPRTLGLRLAAIPSAPPVESQAWDFRMDPTVMSGPYGDRLTIPTHVTPSGGEATHPSIFYAPEKWNGYRYWMAYTPYPGGSDDHEDPNLAVSQDGITWTHAPGVTQPLDDADGQPEYNSDTDLALGPDGVLYLFWRWYDNTLASNQERWYMRTSKDGVTWTAKQLVYQVTDTVRRMMSPAFLYEEGIWKVWAVDILPSTRRLVYMKNSGPDPTTGWGTPTNCTITGGSSGQQPWHVDVRRIGGQYIALLDYTDPGTGGTNGKLIFGTSTDAKTFVAGTASVIPSDQPGEHNSLYRATFIPEVNDGVMGMRVWYSAFLTGPVWNIYRTMVKPSVAGSGPYSQAAGSALGVGVPAGGKTTIAVTFPSGRFTQPPITLVTGYTSSRLTTAVVIAPTTSGFTAISENWTTGVANSPIGIFWNAVQMLSGSAPGMNIVSSVPTHAVQATCPTPGCSNQGVAVELQVPLDLDVVVCGVCGQPISALVFA